MATAEFVQARGLRSTFGGERAAAKPKVNLSWGTLWEYKPFAGRPGSSPENFVPADWLVSRLADLLRVSDADLRKEK